MCNNRNDIILEVKELKTRFKVGKKIVNAVNGVNLALRRGKTLCIVGESGCGKSVTAHSIMQLLPKAGYIESGAVNYYSTAESEGLCLSNMKRGGKEIRAIRGMELAMIFQDPMSALNPVYSIGNQIMENLMQHKKISKKNGKRRIISLLTQLGIPEAESRFDEYPHQFSGGMKQRVMIAIATICNPNILIADEPTTALDVTIQAQILELMKDMQEKYDTSIILITHNMGIVADIADDIAVMYMGRVVEFGTLEQVFRNPLHPYTKALMNSVPVLGIGKGRELESIEGTTPDASSVFTGCEFANRCRHAEDVCQNRFPVETIMPDGQSVRCLIFEGEMQNVK